MAKEGRTGPERHERDPDRVDDASADGARGGRDHSGGPKPITDKGDKADGA